MGTINQVITGGHHFACVATTVADLTWNDGDVFLEQQIWLTSKTDSHKGSLGVKGKIRSQAIITVAAQDDSQSLWKISVQWSIIHRWCSCDWGIASFPSKHPFNKTCFIEVGIYTWDCLGGDGMFLFRAGSPRRLVSRNEVMLSRSIPP